MTTHFTAAIKFFVVVAILIFMSQIGSLTPDLETQHHPSSNDASLTIQEPVTIGLSKVKDILFAVLFQRRIPYGCGSLKHGFQA